MRSLTFLCIFAVLSTALLAAQNRKTNYSNLDDQTTIDTGTTGWGSCSTCAGGQNSTDQFNTSLVATPSRDGQSRQFFVYSTLPYADALWWYKTGIDSPATRFNFNFWFQIDSNAVANSQALEFDTFQFTNGQRYMFGSQCNLTTQIWEVWNEAAKAWVSTGVACPGFSANQWHHLVLSVHRTSDLNMHYDTLTVDNVQYSLNLVEPSGPLPVGWGSNLGVQFQIDLGASGGQGTMWVDNVTLSAR